MPSLFQVSLLKTFMVSEVSFIYHCDSRSLDTTFNAEILIVAGVDADKEDDERALAESGIHHPHLRAVAIPVLYQVRFLNSSIPELLLCYMCLL